MSSLADPKRIMSTADFPADRPSLRERLQSRVPVFGIFVKTPAYQGVEVLGGSDLDFVILDAEHAPFGVATLDQCLLAAKATNLPALVRVAGPAPWTIGEALDMGASGVMVPHVETAAAAAEIVAQARYHGGSRGFSNSPRAGDYGRASMADHVRTSDDRSVVVAMVESRLGIDNAATIAAVPGIDAVFIGAMDLAISLGYTSRTIDEVDRLVAAAASAIRHASLGLLVTNRDEANSARLLGASFIVVGTDQGLLRAGVNAAVAGARD
jgi:2-keto-3-deoxy-L-rhamnonate aldolase RhmA